MSDFFRVVRNRRAWSVPLYWALLVALAGLLLWLAARLLWLLLGWSAPLPEPLPYAPIADAGTAPPALSAWHLFGNASPLTDNRSLAASAPTSTLDLTLVLVWAGRDPRRGMAILRDGEGAEHNYRVGQEVAAGVRLDSVLPDRVLLSRAGAIEVLPLLRAGDDVGAAAGGAAGSGSRTGTAGKPGFVSGNGVVSTTGPMLGTAAMGQVGAPNVPMAGIDLEAVRKQLGADPLELARTITPLPVMENGKLVGVRLHAGANQAVLSRLGLQADDIVTSVNGVALTDPSRIAGVVAGLGQSGKLSVNVRRNGKIETLSLDLH